MIHPDLQNVKMLNTPVNLERYMTQHEKILNYLNKSNTITVKEAMIELGIASLTSRIAELRRDGYAIEGVPKVHPVTGAAYLSYRLAA